MRTAFAWVGAILGGIVVLFLLLIVGGLISIGGNEVNARVQEAQQGSRARQIIANPQRLIDNYDYFFNTCNDIVAFTRQIKTAEDTLAQMKKDYDPATDKFGTGQEAIQQQQRVVQGLYNQRGPAIGVRVARWTRPSPMAPTGPTGTECSSGPLRARTSSGTGTSNTAPSRSSSPPSRCWSTPAASRTAGAGSPAPIPLGKGHTWQLLGVKHCTTRWRPHRVLAPRGG